MKVGVYIEGILPTAGGGITFQREILAALSELKGTTHHSFVAFCAADSAETIPDLTGIPMVRLPHHPRVKSLLRQDLQRVFRAMRRRLFHNNGPSVQASAAMTSLERSARLAEVQCMWFPTASSEPVDLPYLATVWDLQHRLQPYLPESGRREKWRQCDAYYAGHLQRASFVITGSHTGRLEVERFYQVPSDRVKVIRYPTPHFALNALPSTEPEVLRQNGIPKSYLLYPAQFWAQKNHANLLLALQLLHEKHGLVLPAVFVGSDHGNETYIRNMVHELGLSSQVHFLGFVPLNDLVSLYQHALALTFMSFFGPDNLPPLEAFALGCPVIASDISGAREQYGDAALLVDPKSPERIAAAILSLYGDPLLRATLARRGLVRARECTRVDFVRAVFSILDEYEPIRRCWA